MDWMNNPRYQRAIQRLNRMSPSEKAVIDTVAADKHFATEEMRNRLSSMRAAAEREFRKSRLGLAERELGLRRRAIRFQQRQLPIAYGIGGAGVLASGYLGYQRMKADTEAAERLRRLQGLYR